MTIEHISDTARWVAFYRAMETERADAIFRDPYARRLAGPKGEQIVNTIKQGRQMAWAMIVRTAVMDEMILDRVQAGVDLVVNLAAGLDARPWRLALPPALHWVDVDLPDILRYKTEMLGGAAPVCRYEAVEADLTDEAARTSVFTRLGAQAMNALIVTEGLLIYLTADQVTALARDLHAVPSFRWWLNDVATPLLLTFMERSWGDSVRAGNAPFQFAPPDAAEFFAPLGWTQVMFRPTVDDARRLHREMRFMWLWRTLGKLSSQERQEAMRRMSAVELLERGRVPV
ncbi:MAG TPA: SAM-dependent methyltransferase [Gemmatimonadaceae bacterium]|nr:SAM-dependent methyltransferase [Gemmatimonadaceae bacterium]